jgi:SAM-dependent methyltransferase
LRGAKVTGLDYSESLVASAQEIAKQRGLDIEFDVGDAQALPYPDGHFDAVISTFGVIFTGEPERAAKELARVCRPGGRLALAVWTRNGSIATMAREVIAKFSPPPPNPRPPSPFAWGTEARLEELLGAEFDLKIEEASTVLREPDGESVWQLWLDTHGPTVTRVNKLDADTVTAFKNAFVAFHEQYRTELGISMPREYLVAVGTRR